MATQSFSSEEYLKFDGHRFDLLKFILALFIVGIHSRVCLVLQPVFRLGVPMFFVMTSYFFFLKQSRLGTKDEKRVAMKKYAARILKLYLFWFIVLLPLTIYYRSWYVDVGFSTVLKIVRSFLFSSTFKASWFLMASLLAVLFVWYLSDRITNSVQVVIGLLLYAICCFTSNYYFLCERIPGCTAAYQVYKSIFTAPYNSFPVALIFVLAGKYLAENHIFVPNRLLCIFVLSSFIMLYTEFSFLSCFTVVDDDCYFSLLPLSIGLFMIIGQNHIQISGARLFRPYSTIIFCAHASLAPIVMGVLQHYLAHCGRMNGALCFVATFIGTVLICLTLAKILLHLSYREHFWFLRYAY